MLSTAKSAPVIRVYTVLLRVVFVFICMRLHELVNIKKHKALLNVRDVQVLFSYQGPAVRSAYWLTNGCRVLQLLRTTGYSQAGDQQRSDQQGNQSGKPRIRLIGISACEQ